MQTEIEKYKLPRVMLVNPPQKIYKHAWNSGLYFPVGLLYVAAVIRDKCTLKILDCMIDDFEIKKFDNYELQGTPDEKIYKYIMDFNPDIVGISVPFTSQSENAINVCNIVKDINPNITVVLGGPDPSIRYDHLLNNTKADYCVVGEGEETFPEIIYNYSQNLAIEGVEVVAYKKDNKADGSPESTFHLPEFYHPVEPYIPVPTQLCRLHPPTPPEPSRHIFAANPHPVQKASGSNAFPDHQKMSPLGENPCQPLSHKHCAVRLESLWVFHGPGGQRHIFSFCEVYRP